MVAGEMPCLTPPERNKIEKRALREGRCANEAKRIHVTVGIEPLRDGSSAAQLFRRDGDLGLPVEYQNEVVEGKVGSMRPGPWSIA